MKWADFASCQAEITALMNDRINQVPSAAKFHWHLHRVGFHHTSRHLLRSTGRGEGVALHPTLGYFYSWERRWWTWTRGLEAFPRQFTKAVKPELELTRPQIPRSAAPNVSLALNLQGPCAPERNFPGSAQVEFFCTQIKSLSQIPVFSTSAGTWNRYSKLISISSPPGGHNLRGYRQGSGTERLSMTCKSFACPDAGLLENTRSSQDHGAVLISIRWRWVPWKSIPGELHGAAQKLLARFILSPFLVAKTCWSWGFTGNTEWFPWEEPFHTCLPNKLSHQSGNV